MQDYFNELVNSFKELPLDTKEKMLINEMKEMIALYIQIAETYEIDYVRVYQKDSYDARKRKASPRGNRKA